MMNWLDAIASLAADGKPAVLVTVASAHGSVPREAGAKMVVTADTQFDTIGGGHLELQACTMARALLMRDPTSPDSGTRLLQRFALGPSLGQCCGGSVELAFELLDRQACAKYRQLLGLRATRKDSWRLVPLDSTESALLCDAHGKPLADTVIAAPRFDDQRPCHVQQDAQGKRWLIDPCRADAAHLILFGAGHVGTALVRMLGALPCRVTWVDEREDMFPADLPANVTVECTDLPEAVVNEAEPGASFLVMTHSHALDQRLAEAILLRGEDSDHGWFGLIGSRTKRVQFERRLRARGIAEERLAGMTCPIGIPGIRGKQPAVIAASVCAQLLQVWEAQAAQRETLPGTTHRAA